MASRLKLAHAVAHNPVSISAKNIEDIRQLEQAAVAKRSRSERIAQSVTQVAGSALFIAIHIAWFAIWIALNIGWISSVQPWDPFPFSFLTLIVSLEAIFLSLLVLMTQNRLTRDADKRALLDLHINMLAEQESTASLRMLEKICKHLGIDYVPEEAQQLAKTTDVTQIAEKLEEKIEDESGI